MVGKKSQIQGNIRIFHNSSSFYKMCPKVYFIHIKVKHKIKMIQII